MNDTNEQPSTPPPAAATFHAWLQSVYAKRFTGAVVVHFAQGVANVVEIPCEPTRIKLDKR